MKQNKSNNAIKELNPEKVNTNLEEARALFKYCGLEIKTIVRKSGISARQLNIYRKDLSKLHRAQYDYVLRLASLFKVEYAKQVGGSQIEEGHLFQKLVKREEDKVTNSLLTKYIHYEENPDYADVFSSIINKNLLTYYPYNAYSRNEYQLAILYHICVQAGLPVGNVKPQLKNCDILTINRKVFNKSRDEVNLLLNENLDKITGRINPKEKLTEKQIAERIGMDHEKYSYQIDKYNRLVWQPCINEFFLKLGNENKEELLIGDDTDLGIGILARVEAQDKNNENYSEVLHRYIPVHEPLRKRYTNSFWHDLGCLCGYWL